MTKEDKIKEICQSSIQSLGLPLSNAIANAITEGYKLGGEVCVTTLQSNNEWKPIPKDKSGFFDETSDLYDELPIIIMYVYGDVHDEDTIMYYIDEGNWHDTLSDFSNPHCKLYMPCGKIPTEE